MALSLMPAVLDWLDDSVHRYRYRMPAIGLCLELPVERVSPSKCQPLRRSHRLSPFTVARELCQRRPEVVSTSDKFQVLLDTNGYNLEDIKVKTVDNYVLISGKHEEKSEDGEYVRREFSRKYLLPEDVEPEAVVSSLSSDGILVVEAPKITKQITSNERDIPVKMREVSSDQKNDQDEEANEENFINKV